MRPSPLQLEKHFFSKVEIVSHVDGESGVPNSLTCEIEIGQAADNPRRFQVTLRLKLGSPEEKKTTYTGDIHAIGLFRVLDGWPESEIGTLVDSNGAAVLFGAIRELVFNLTSRGPWPPVLLNTFTFIPSKEKADHQSKLVEGENISK